MKVENFFEELKTKYIKFIQEYWYVFNKDNIENFFSYEEIDFLLSEKYIFHLYKKIYVAISPTKTIDMLWNSEYKLGILSMITEDFEWDYFCNAQLSLAYYIRKIKWLSNSLIKIINLKRNTSLKLNWLWEIGTIKVNKIEKEQYDSIFVNRRYKLNIFSQEYLLKYLFEKNVYQKDIFQSKDIKIFLEQFNWNIDKIFKLIWKNKYILKNVFDFYKEHKIYNKKLVKIFINEWYTTKIDEEKYNKENNTRDKSWETGTIIRMKEMIDKIIDFNIVLDKEMNIWKFLKTYSNDVIIENINKEKTNDIYHSTTIEWYKITKDQVEWIDKWILPSYLETEDEKNKFKRNIENELIIKSYKRTFEMIVNDYLFNDKEFSKEDLVKINYYEFIEAYEKNWTKLEDHNYRKHIVRMNGCDWYTPPETINEIDILVDYLFERIKEIDNHLLRWIAFHFLLVPIQPFWDWNGRLSRFMMNIFFSLWKYKWVVIDQHDYRLQYLSSYWLIENYKYYELVDVYIKFLNFILHYVEWKDEQLKI